MKKITNFLIGAIFGFVLVSCGTSHTEKVTYQNNSQKVLKESFNEEAPVAVKMPVSPTIQLMDSVFIPALKTLNVQECFSTDKKEAIANFYHGSNFNDWLYQGGGQIGGLPGFWLKIYRTTQTTTDREILSQTGDNLLSEQQLFQAWSYLISKQPNGGNGKLQLNYWNIFYVKTKSGATVAADAIWFSAYDVWYLDAHVLVSWYVGNLVFSRGN